MIGKCRYTFQEHNWRYVKDWYVKGNLKHQYVCRDIRCNYVANFDKLIHDSDAVDHEAIRAKTERLVKLLESQKSKDYIINKKRLAMENDNAIR